MLFLLSLQGLLLLQLVLTLSLRLTGGFLFALQLLLAL